jgi:hypothetical protein
MEISKIIFLGFVALFNSILWPIVMLNDKDQILLNFLYLTLLNFTLCTTYFISRFIYQIKIFLNKSNENSIDKIKNNCFFNFMNEQFSKFVFSICITVCQVYWLLILGGEKLMIFPQDNLFMKFLGVYLHLIIGIFVYIDMHFIEITPNKKHYYRDFYIYNFIQISYSILLTILAKNYKACLIYPFLELNFYQIFSINIVIMFAYRNSYQFYHHIHKRNKQKYNYKNNNNFNNTFESQKTGISFEKPFLYFDKNLN